MSEHIEQPTESLLSADVLAKCLETTSPEVISAFKSFVVRNSDSRWIVVSDYHREKDPAYTNDVLVFTVLPNEQNKITMEAVKAGLPCKLSSSRVDDDVISFLQGLNHFTFAFIFDKKFRPFAKTTEDIYSQLDATIAGMERWENAADCIETIDKIKSLRKQNKFSVKTLNHAILAANLAAGIAALISKDVDVRAIYWASDRDDIIESWDRITDTFFNVSVSAFLQQRMKPAIEEVGCYAEQTSDHQTEIPKQSRKAPPLWYGAYVNIPDHFAAPIAQANCRSEGIFHADREKYTKIMAYVAADNANVAILRLVHVEAGWGFHHVKVSQQPITL